MALTLILALVSLILAILYLSINIILVVIYNKRRHKFFKINSPRLPVVPNPDIFLGNVCQTMWSPKNYQLIDEWHNQLGLTFGHYRCDIPYVSTKDINLIKKIMIDDAVKHRDRIDFRAPLPRLNESIAQAKGNDWHRLRMSLAPSLTNLRVRGNEVSPDIELTVARFIEGLERKLDDAERSTNKRSIIIDVHDHMKRIIQAISFLVLFRKDRSLPGDYFYADEDKRIKDQDEAVKSMLHPMMKLLLALPFLSPIASWLFQFSAMGKNLDKVIGLLLRTIDLHRTAEEKKSRMQKGTDDEPLKGSESQTVHKRRLIDGFIDKLFENKINLDEFVGTTLFLMAAAGDTTASTTTCLLWNLAQNCNIQDKLREALKTEGIDAYYVVWCIMEAIRWHPAVPFGSGRVITEDIMTDDGLLIPKGSHVMPSVYSIHRDNSIWPNADQFIPERWRYQSRFHPAAFVGFGLGPRNCIGYKMAIHQIKLIIEGIITRYKVETCEETVNEYKFISPMMVFTIPEEPVKLRFTPLAARIE